MIVVEPSECPQLAVPDPIPKRSQADDTSILSILRVSAILQQEAQLISPSAALRSNSSRNSSVTCSAGFTIRFGASSRTGPAGNAQCGIREDRGSFQLQRGTPNSVATVMASVQLTRSSSAREVRAAAVSGLGVTPDACLAPYLPHLRGSSVVLRCRLSGHDTVAAHSAALGGGLRVYVAEGFGSVPSRSRSLSCSAGMSARPNVAKA